jgi:hypothetical protein
MNTNLVAKSIAKGLALGVLWPTAAVVVVSRRLGKLVNGVGSEALDMARGWEEAAEVGVTEAYHQTFPPKKPTSSVVVPAYAARSVGAASATDPNVTGKFTWDDVEAWWLKRSKREQLALQIMGGVVMVVTIVSILTGITVMGVGFIAGVAAKATAMSGATVTPGLVLLTALIIGWGVVAAAQAATS